MKPETARGLRRLLPRRKRARPGRSDPGIEGRAADSDFDPQEFAEFLEADEGPIPVDPGFKEELRKRLWSMVRERADARSMPRGRPRGRLPGDET